MTKHEIFFSTDIKENLLETLDRQIPFPHQLQRKSLIIETDELSDYLPEAVKVLKINEVDLETKKKSFKVLGYSCASCANSAETVLKYVDGVYGSSANYANHSVTVEYLPQLTNPEVFKSSLKEIGFDLVLDDNFESANQQRFRTQKRDLILAGFFAVPLFIIGMFLMDWSLGQYVMWALCTPLVFYFGRHFFINAWNKAKRLETNMDTLVALSTGVAYVFSVVNLVFPHLLHQHHHAQIYFESAGIVIFFVLLGKYLEDSAKNRASDSIKKLMKLDEKNVKVLVGQQIVEKLIDEVNHGDLVRVLPGQKIPLDGKVVVGTSSVNESMITGEPIPKSKSLGDMVFAGTINVEGVLDFEVTKVHSETYLASIITKVEDALSSKAPIQKKVDKISSIFVPVVISAAALSFLVWYFVFNNANMALLSFITVLVVACPCAMGLATPTALMVGIGKGAQNGILIKNAESLEKTGRITDLVLDKTGTITTGKPKVIKAFWKDESKKSILAALEANSSHPLAHAIVDFLPQKEFINIQNFENIPGKGIKGIFEGQHYLAGNKQFILQNEIEIPKNDFEDSENSLVYFATEKELLGIIEIGDELKPEIEKHLSEITNQGIKVHLLSGDNALAVKNMAQKLGISDYKGEVLPEHKADYINSLKTQKRVIAMVGDGINDTLAFTQADVSIAMSDGADVAKEVADITILGNDLSRVKKAITLSKNTTATINQNLFWAFFYNILAIPVAAGLLFPSTGFLMQPMYASAAMAMSSISVVANSLRLKIKKINT
ncbi:heavy metal translocating P-type ATPase [Lacihabitans soyangensis]|uniref:Copper-translocating P-type ATPase n=1 Tax=Lacihabitans soyangensis TaxID=869394 RepID=A0AAE3H751_9BACT|nr:heavy metal translocating P-type ATPase [Lacihabitans soyangensis]MCP9765299.1 copper-translocating P-type ATPase [Lacihabitans soyangensis]